MARCKWCNSEIGDNKVCPYCKANQNGEVTGKDIEYVPPFEKYGKNDSRQQFTSSKDNSNVKNGIANMIKVCAYIIIILGGIGGFILMMDNFGIGLISILACGTSGLFCLGFAEIIQLLDDIKNKLK